MNNEHDEDFEGWLRRVIAGPLYTACVQTATTMSEKDHSKEPLECLQMVIGGVISAVIAEADAHGDDDLASEISRRHEQNSPPLH